MLSLGLAGEFFTTSAELTLFSLLWFLHVNPERGTSGPPGETHAPLSTAPLSTTAEVCKPHALSTDTRTNQGCRDNEKRHVHPAGGQPALKRRKACRVWPQRWTRRQSVWVASPRQSVTGKDLRVPSPSRKGLLPVSISGTSRPISGNPASQVKILLPSSW